MIRPTFPQNSDLNQRWDDCVICGTSHRTVELQFENGSTEPSVGDILTGASSTDSGTVVSVALWTGTWAGSDAAGIIELSSPSGLSSQTADTNPFTAFTLSENINNTTTAESSVMTCSSTALGQGKQYGRPHPEGEVIKYRGNIYCRWHFNYRFEREWREEEHINIEEDYSEWI